MILALDFSFGLCGKEKWNNRLLRVPCKHYVCVSGSALPQGNTPNSMSDVQWWGWQWHLVNLLLGDPSLNDVHKVRRILKGYWVQLLMLLNLLESPHQVLMSLSLILLLASWKMERSYLQYFSALSKAMERNPEHTWTGVTASSQGQFPEGGPQLKIPTTSYSDSSVGAVGIRASS